MYHKYLGFRKFAKYWEWGKFAASIGYPEAKRFSASGGHLPLDPDPRYRLALRARHVCLVTVSWVCTNVLLCSSWGEKYSSWVLNTCTFIVQKVAIFAGKNSKIASLMSCQRSDLRKTLKHSHSCTLCLIFEYPTVKVRRGDAAPAICRLA